MTPHLDEVLSPFRPRSDSGKAPSEPRKLYPD